MSVVRCHCNKPVVYGFDGDSTHHRGMCEQCDAVRCDAYPGACRVLDAVPDVPPFVPAPDESGPMGEQGWVTHRREGVGNGTWRHTSGELCPGCDEETMRRAMVPDVPPDPPAAGRAAKDTPSATDAKPAGQTRRADPHAVGDEVDRLRGRVAAMFMRAGGDPDEFWRWLNGERARVAAEREGCRP